MSDGNSLDLRKHDIPAAAAAGARPEVQMPGHGVLPLTAGQVVSLTPAEEAQVKALKPDWQTGDPVPTNLGAAIQQIQNESAGAGHLPVDPSTPAIDVDKLPTVDITELAPEKQQELQQAMTDMMERERIRGEATADEIPGADPSINAAIHDAATQEAIAQREKAAPGLADVAAAMAEGEPTAGKAPPALPDSQAATPPLDFRSSAATADTQTVWQPKPTQETAPLSEMLPDPPVAATAPPSRTGAVGDKACAHCGWPHDKPDTIVPTDADKYNFLAAVLGGQRFYRTVELLGGKLKITFRTLLSNEAAACLEQIAHDARNNKLTGEGDWWRQHALYRMAAGIETVQMAGGGAFTLPALAAVQVDQTMATPLPSLLDYIFEKVLPQENIRRFVGREHTRFQRLTEKLEARLDDADFWKGIAAPAS